MGSFENRITTLQVRHLDAFVALAEELHFGRAAARLGIAQPLFSTLIQRIEEAMGETLFERRPNVKLTAAGKVLRVPLQRARGEIASGLLAVRNLASGITGCLKVGYPPWLIASPIPDRIRKYRAEFPQVDLQLLDSVPSKRLLEQDSDIEVALVTDNPAPQGLTLQPIFSVPWILAIPADHRLSVEHSISVQEIAGEPFVAFPRLAAPSLFDQFMRLFDPAGARPVIVQEADAWLSVVSLVRSGIGIAIVPGFVRDLWSSGIRYLDLRDRRETVTVSACYRTDLQSEAARQFVAFLTLK